jgi:hypothetical protein
MVKSIKKTFKYFIIAAGIIFMFPTVFYLALRIPEVQTLIIKRVTSHFSEVLKSTISIGRIEYSFFNILKLDQFLIRDNNNDTLVYSGKVSAVIKNVDFKRKSFKLGRVILVDPVVSIIKDSSGLMNLKWFISKIKPSGNQSEGKKSELAINQIDISNAKFSLINRLIGKPAAAIDFNNLHISGMNGIVENFRIYDDTTSFDIYNLAFRESEGFNVKRLNSEVKLTKKGIEFNSAILNCDSSLFKVSHAGVYGDSTASFRNFVEEVRLDILLDESFVSTYDLGYFIPSVQGLNESAVLSGKIAGTISELRGRSIRVSFGENSVLNCDFDFSGLPEIENSFIYLGINNLRTNAKDIAEIRIPGGKSFKVPDVIYKLGPVTLNGSFTGFTTDFVAYGKIRTSEGTISTDISFRPEESNRYKIKGLLTGSSIALGKVTGKSGILGNVSFRSDLDGYAYSLKKFTCDITGLVDSIEINNYKYRNIALNGIVSEKAWDGNIKINERNIKMDLLGMFNFSGELPEVDFTLNLANANLYNLHFDKADTSAALSMLLTANFKGSNIDNLDGDIKLLNSNLRKHGKTLELYDFSIRTFAENGKPAISLQTDFLDADLKGEYNFSGLGSLAKYSISTLMPSGLSAAALPKEAFLNNFVYDIRFKNTDRINNFFQTGILLSDKSFLTGKVFADSIIKIRGEAKTLSLKNNIFSDLVLEGNLENDSLNIRMNSSVFKTLGESEFKGFSALLRSESDNFIFSVNWDNKDIVLNEGNIIARGTFFRNENNYGKPVLRVEVDSTGIYNHNNLWNISRSTILIDSNSLHINRLNISNKERFYLIRGTISENPADTMSLQFRGIDISPLDYFLSRKMQSGQIPLSISGEMNGVIHLNDVYRNFLFESNLQVNNFSMLQSNYGNLSVVSVWNPEKKVADIRAGNNLNGKKMLDILGYYNPVSKTIDLTGNADKLPIDALNPILKVFASNISGTATGRVNLSGIADKLVLEGALLVENASMKIDYLQTIYKLNDSIRFARNSIIFKDVRIADEKGNTATLNGTIFHKYFKEYGADLTINTNEFMVLNTKPKDNELFYGTTYASGVTTIKSGPSSLSFDISASTGRNTKFSIPLNTGETISEYSFVSFVDADSTAKDETKQKAALPANTNKLGLDLNFDLEITPDAEVKLIFDEKVGDEIIGTGSGNLNIRLDQKGNFRIYGDYTIEDGTYLFTLKNLLNKRFKVENGGRISFNGDINNAEIDMKAIYTTNALLSGILQDEKYNERTEVECQINLSGNLFNPVVKLDIYLPNSDESTRTLVKNAITTEEELNRQFLYLLVMNSFFSDNSYSQNLASTTTQTGTSAMAVTTTEMISNQLSNWLSQISNDFDVGFNYRPGGYTDISTNELELAFKTQILNDKVTINGNFDVRGAGTNNTDNLTGDFDVEYRLTQKIRFKVFNRFNNPSSGKQSDYTQGLGIFYMQDFNKFSDLFRKKVKSDMKKEDDNVLPEQ